jgi:hypothetical protein
MSLRIEIFDTKGQRRLLTTANIENYESAFRDARKVVDDILWEILSPKRLRAKRAARAGDVLDE